MLYSVMLVSAYNMKRHKYTFVASLLNLPPTSHPMPPLWVVTQHWIELPVSYSNFHDKLGATMLYTWYVSVLLWQFDPPSPSLTVATSMFSMSMFLEMDI